MTIRPTIHHVDAMYRTDFASFIGKSFHTLAPSSRFHMNWHIAAAAYHLEQVRLGKIRRLIINMPPRSLKSIMSSVAFPAFVLGHDPSKRLIAASYGSDLAIKHSIDFRVLLNSPWYQRVFLRTRISRLKNTELEVATTLRGFRLATSIDGTLTGRGGDIIVIDDPLKPIDALSDSKRERVNDWFNNTLLSRLDNMREGAIIIVMQRLHMDDLAGTLLRASDEWTLLCFPAIAEQDERIQIGQDSYHIRRAGDLLHAELVPKSALEFDPLSNRLGHIFGAVPATACPAGWRLDQASLGPSLRPASHPGFIVADHPKLGHGLEGRWRERFFGVRDLDCSAEQVLSHRHYARPVQLSDIEIASHLARAHAPG